MFNKPSAKFFSNFYRPKSPGIAIINLSHSLLGLKNRGLSLKFDKIFKSTADHPECFAKHINAKQNVSRDGERLVRLACKRNSFLLWSQSLDTIFFTTLRKSLGMIRRCVIVSLLLIYLPIKTINPNSPNPFDLVTIKSKNASVEKSSDDKNIWKLKYQNNVSVLFSDSSTVSSDSLEVISSGIGSDVKKVIFKDNVHLTRLNQKIDADEVEFFVQEKVCKMFGNVKVEQTKQKEKDVPVTTCCNEAQLNWETGEVNLIGNDDAPVITQISLENRVKTPKKKKI